MIEENNLVYQKLYSSYKRDRLSHAYLFIGDKGSQMLPLAKTFMKMLYCKETFPCNTCSPCTQIEHESHPNLLIIRPEGMNIKKDQIDNLQIEFSKTSLVDGPRVYIIDNAEKMNLASGNRLLKFIEEPVGKETIGILIANNLAQILPTIVSRCQIIYFPNVNQEEVASLLEKEGIEPLYAIASTAVSTDKDELIEYLNHGLKDVIDLVLALGRGYALDESMAFLFNMNLGKIEGNMDPFLRLLTAYFMDILHKKSHIPLKTFPFEEETFEKLASKLKKERICEVLDILLDCETKLKYNVNEVLMIEKALLDIEVK